VLLYASLLYALLQSSDGLSFAFSLNLATPFWLGWTVFGIGEHIFTGCP
jgi:hypothetical protein